MANLADFLFPTGGGGGCRNNGVGDVKRLPVGSQGARAHPSASLKASFLFPRPPAFLRAARSLPSLHQHVLSQSLHNPPRQASEADRGDGVFFLDGSQPGPAVSAAVSAALLASAQQQLWVLQRYVARPLLLRGRKFHLRVMILAVGDLSVFVHRNAVALFASDDFSAEDFSDRRAAGDGVRL